MADSQESLEQKSLRQESLDGVFTLKNGRQLHLGVIRRDAVMPILLRMGRLDVFDDAGRFQRYVANLPTRARNDIVTAFYQLFNYCVGWGVLDDPDDIEIDDLIELGFRSSSVRTTRVNWVRYMLISDDEEAGALAGAVLAHSMNTWDSNDQEQETEEKQQDELEALRARVAELEAKESETKESELGTE